MFIPDTVVGKRISLMRALKVPGGTFTVGHIFEITGTCSRGLSLKDDEGRIVIEANLREGIDYKEVVSVHDFLSNPFN